MSENYSSEGNYDSSLERNPDPKTNEKNISHYALQTSFWTWAAIFIGYLLMIILSQFLGWFGLIFLIFGVYGLGLGFSISSIMAIIGLIRKVSPSKAIVALVLNFPVYLIIYSQF